MGPGFRSVISGAWPGVIPRSPRLPCAITISTRPEKISASALTMSQWIVMAIRLPHVRLLPSAQGLQFLGFLDGFVDAANHVERLLRQVIVVTFQDAAEASDGVLQGNVLARGAGEDFGHEERLGQEALDLTSTGYQLLVRFGQLVHTEDRDDVLQFLVALQYVLHATRGLVVLLTNHQRIELTGGGV